VGDEYKFKIAVNQEVDGRWIAEGRVERGPHYDIPNETVVYGATIPEAVAACIRALLAGQSR
jgi:hypothetical protein